MNLRLSMFKKLLSVCLSVALLMSFATPTFAASNSSVNSNLQSTKVLHKDAPAPIVSPMDVGAPWTENYSMHNITSTHFTALIISVVTTALAGQFGGKVAYYTGIANSIIFGGYSISDNNVWEDIHYYYQDSGDPNYPYYIKQFIVYYTNSSMTTYIGSTTRYYYSTVDF